MSSGVDSLGELPREPLDRDRQKALERLERARIRAAVEEDAEETRQRQAAPLGAFRRTAPPRRICDG